MKSIRELLKENPDNFVIKAKIWTERRNTIESHGAHDPAIGKLVSLLLIRRIPSDRERELIEQLSEVLRMQNGGL